jgi:ABC-type phosphate transport system substrate-binding protein
MVSRLSTWMAVALTGGVLVAGCGSSSTNTSSTSTTTQSTTTVAASTTAGGSTAPAAVDSAAIQQAVAACKHGVQAASGLSSSTKAKIENICNKASDGDLTAAREAARELCIEVINASPIPSGSIKEQAINRCKTED